MEEYQKSETEKTDTEACDYCNKPFARCYKIITQRFCADKACTYRWRGTKKPAEDSKSS